MLQGMRHKRPAATAARLAALHDTLYQDHFPGAAGDSFARHSPMGERDLVSEHAHINFTHNLSLETSRMSCVRMYQYLTLPLSPACRPYRRRVFPLTSLGRNSSIFVSPTTATFAANQRICDDHSITSTKNQSRQSKIRPRNKPTAAPPPPSPAFGQRSNE